MSTTAGNMSSTKRLKYVVSLRRSRADGIQDDGQYIGLENIGSGTGQLVVSEATSTAADDMSTPTSESLSNTFHPGDVLFGKLRPYLAKAWMANFSGRCSTELLVMKPTGVDSRYLCYVLLSRDFVDAVDASTFGSKMPRADWDFIGNMRIPLPPAGEQRAIADYLDFEITRLGRLMETNEQLLQLLREKGRAFTAHAVTRGLDPRVPYRDSGIPWLGCIPSHWQVERARWLFQERDERSATGSEELLTVSHLTGVTPRSEKDVNMFEAESTQGYKTCYQGDLVINTLWAWMGAMGVSRVKGIVSPAYNVYTPGPRLDPSYVDALVRIPMFAQEATRNSKGVWSSRLRLYPESFFEIWLPTPPIDEQQAIVAHIHAETRELDVALLAATRMVSLIKERRSSLISGAVAGRFGVEGAN